MSSSEASTTPEASAPESDATANVVKFNPLSLIPDFVDVVDPTDLRSVSAVIRDEASYALKQPLVMAEVKPFLAAGNHAGTANGAHNQIGRIIIGSSKILTRMMNEGDLTYASAWRQIHTVFKKSGYLFESGYFLANTRDEAAADAAEAAAEVAEADAAAHA